MIRLSKYSFMLLLFFIFLDSAYAAKICYFSLNNSKEFQEMDKFTTKLNRYTKDKEKIEVKEFLTPGDNAEESFSRMVESGEQCDGLVISGHHTGSFGGQNSPVTLSLEHMEKLSCNPQFKKFFSNIKALWLQGCRTLGVGKIEAYEDPDYHMQRVGDALAEDNLPQSFAQLNMEFSATLDKDNPLSSRYLRVFPRATTFGWTKTAPGEKAHSEYSIPFHIANIAKINDDRGRFFDNPVGDTISPESAVRYLISLQKILGQGLDPLKVKCNRDEKKLVEAWLDHGKIKDSKFAFDNPDLNAYESLFESNNKALIKAGHLDCLLKNADDSSLIDSVDTILKDEALIGYSYNTITETLQRLKEEGKFDLLLKIQNKLKSSELLQNFLMRKLGSNELGILRKIDYYAFWREMTGSSNTQVENLIGDAFVKMALTPLHDDRNRIDYIDTLFKSMAAHKLITPNQLEQIINSPKTDKDLLLSVAYIVGDSATAIPGAEKIFLRIIDLAKTDNNLLASVVYAIGDSKTPITGTDKMLQQIVSLSKSENVLNSIVALLGVLKTPVEGADKILLKILKSNCDKEALLYTINNSKIPDIINNRNLLLKEISTKKNK